MNPSFNPKYGLFFDFYHANKTKKPQAILTLKSRVFLGKMGIFV